MALHALEIACCGRRRTRVDFLLVHQHVAVPGECLTAISTLMVLDSRVRGDVSRQIAARDECLLAHGANLIANARVNLQMRLEIAQSRKLFAANLALIGPVPGMGAHVNGEVVLLGEASRTEVAGEWTVAVVRANVHLQLGGALERLGTLEAGLRCLFRGLWASLLALLGLLAFIAARRIAFAINYEGK